MKKLFIFIGAFFVFCFNAMAQPTFTWAKQMTGVGYDLGYSIALDGSGNVYTTGFFFGTVDFDPGPGTFNLTSVSNDVYISKLDANGNFVWAKKIGAGGSNDEGYSITLDASGNVYTTGIFDGTVDFDPGIGVFNMTAAGSDAFISKLDVSGNFVWAKKIGGVSADGGYSIVVDDSANVYTMGSYNGTVDFDPGPGTFNLTSAGAADVFISKLNASGNFVWVKNIAGTGNGQANSIALDSAGNIYSIGTFTGTVDLDPGPGTFNLTAAAGADIFISKLDASGNFVWAKKMGGASNDTPQSIVVDNSGNIYSTGYFSSTVDFDPGLGTFNLTSAGSVDIFVSKLDVSGNFVWAKKMGGTGNDLSHSIALDASGNIYTTGFFSNTTDFDPGPGTFNLTSTAMADIFMSKLDNAGNFIWAIKLEGAGNEDIWSIALDGSGNLYATGYFNDMMDFDPGAGTFNLTATGGDFDIFVVKMAGCALTPAQPGTISGPITTCENASNTYTISSIADATSYTWTLPGGWSGTSTTNSISITPSATSGNITVTANNACGSSSPQTLAITVNPLPLTPGTISGSTSICTGSSNTYSIAAVSGATSYTWTLPGGWSGTSTTNSINTTASATGGNITVTANNTCGNSSPQTLAITVNTTPPTPGTISGNTSICAGSSNTYSIAAVSGATSYTWTLPGGWSGTSTTNSINTTAGVTSGNISVTANNTCGNSSPQTLAITVNTTPPTPGTISGNTSICAGSSNTYSIAAVSGATSYTWTLPGGWSGTSTANSINTTAGSTSGNITVTANNTCGNSSPQTLAITVNSTPPTPGTISGSTSICVANANTYSITAVAGATSYTWTLPGGWSGTSTTNSINTTAGSTGGNITVTANNTCGNSSPQTLAITVNTTPPTPGTISGNTSICAGSSNTYSIAAVAGATSYTWTLPGGWSGTSTANSINTTANTTGGNITVTANNACGNSSPQIIAITVNTTPTNPGTISGNTNICEGTANTYSITPVSGATSYTWTLPGGWTGTSTTNSINTTAGSTSGNITVTANNTCGNSSPQTLPITVNTTPATPGTISGNTSICASAANTYSITPVSGATSYTWTLPGGWSGTSTTNSINTTASAIGGNITVTANNACGNSAPQTLAITVNTIPTTPGTISGTTSICAGNANTYSIAAVAGAISYTWTLPGGWSGTSTTNSINTTAGSTSGNISVTANNTCGNSSPQTLAITVNSIPATPGTISGNTNICEGTANTYSIAAVSGATSYTWTLPGGWSGTSTTNSINTTTSATGGNITVTANNTCGNSSPQIIAITVNTTPTTPGTISGNANICEGTANTYSITPVADATSYTWILPGGWSGTSSTNSINTTAGSTSGNISVTANNTCGNSSPQTLAITVNSTPSTPGTISGSTNICAGSANTYSITPVGDATSYIWTLPGGWAGISTTNSINTTANSTGGNITVTANNTCGNSSPQTITITVNNSPTVNFNYPGNDTVCINHDLQTLTGGTPSGGTYSGTGVAGNNFDPNAAGIGTHTIIYEFTDPNNCTSSDTVLLQVNACLGIENGTAQAIIIYPNPNYGNFIVQIQGEENYLMKVYDISGKLMRIDQLISGKNNIEINVSSGLYFVHLFAQDNKEIIIKLVIQ